MQIILVGLTEWQYRFTALCGRLEASPSATGECVGGGRSSAVISIYLNPEFSTTKSFVLSSSRHHIPCARRTFRHPSFAHSTQLNMANMANYGMKAMVNTVKFAAGPSRTRASDLEKMRKPPTGQPPTGQPPTGQPPTGKPPTGKLPLGQRLER